MGADVKTQQKKSNRMTQPIQYRRNSNRCGAAAVEAALIFPMLIVLVFVALDIGQFVNVAQTVSNASREGAQLACKNSTVSSSEVVSKVQTYLQSCFPQVEATTLNESMEIEVLDDKGVAFPEGDLSVVPAGTEISVRVAFEFSAVRWLDGFSVWSGDVKETISVGCRE